MGILTAPVCQHHAPDRSGAPEPRGGDAQMPETVLTVGDLFSGIQTGGMSLGLRMAGGFETRWFVETDPYCVRVLNKHWPDVPVYGDIRELRGCDVEPVDVLVGGWPCQPVSVAGRRGGDADDRWLWPEFSRLIREIRPQWVLAENVPGLRSIDDGRLFGTVLSDLATCGYVCEWDGVPASAAGAHHIRDRVWMVAYPDGYLASDGGQCPRVSAADRGWRDDRSRGDGDARREVAVGIAGQTETILPNHARHIWGSPCHDGHEPSNGRGSGVWRDWWISEPNVVRVVHGLPTELDRARLRGLGNAVVPAVVAQIGRRIAAASATPCASRGADAEGER